MEFLLLGEIEVRAAGQLLNAGTPRSKAVLAALVVDAGRPVAIEALIDRVWDENPPAEARNVLYSHLSRIRRLLRHASRGDENPAQIVRRHAGYVLDVDPDLVDLHRFQRLAAQGSDRRHDDVARAAALTEALELWRGPPLAGLSGGWVAHVRDRWHRHRLDVAMQWAEVELRIGNPVVVITALPDLAAEYPLAEPLEAMLMKALHAAGRDAEAIDRYATVRHRLADELGTEPSAALRDLHQAILRGEPPVDRGPVTATAFSTALFGRHPVEGDRPSNVIARPAQLPATSPTFVGRDLQIRAMTAILAGVAPLGAPRTVAIAGPPGVGKTTLAVCLAHEVAEHYIDGQLYVDLRGYSPERQSRSVNDVLEEFLAAFGVVAIPVGVERRAALFRSVLADRRVLVVLDNAVDSEQLRPLLPGSAGCGVVITTRRRLSGMAISSAQRFSLGPLAEDESTTLIRMIIGVERAQDEPDAVRALVGLCDRLPLALRIAAEQIVINPHQPISELVRKLAIQTRRLDALTVDDSAAVRTVFSWSYRDLSPACARMFRLLGLHRGRHVSTGAAAALADESTVVARGLLDQLARVHLVEGFGDDLYRIHDLLGIYAAELVIGEQAGGERILAVRRVVDWYLHNAYAANHVLAPQRHDPVLEESDFAIDIADFDYDQALAWCEGEMENIAMATRMAVEVGENVTAWKLPVGCFNYLYLRKQWNSWIVSHQAGVVGARRAGDRFGEAWVTNNLAVAYREMSLRSEARTLFDQALAIRHEIHDRVGQAWTLFGVAFLDMEEGAFDDAATRFEKARTVFRETGEHMAEAVTIASSGDAYRRMGDFGQALTSLRQALQLFEAFSDSYGEGLALAGLGDTYAELNQPDEALNCFQQALEKRREIGDRWGEGEVLHKRGHVHFSAAQPEQARECLQAALEIFDDLGDPRTSEVRRLLDMLR